MKTKRTWSSLRGRSFDKTRIHSLSFSSLRLVDECACCFWRQLHRAPRPSFPIAGALIRLDLLQKEIMEDGIFNPHLTDLSKQLPGYQVAQLAPTLSVEVEDLRFRLIARLDALIQVGEHHLPVDNKSFGRPKEEADLRRYYALQGSVYNLALSRSGYAVRQDCVFLQWIPQLSKERQLAFDAKATILHTPVKDALDVLARARVILDGPVPLPNPNCQWCAWALELNAGKSKGTGQ